MITIRDIFHAFANEYLERYPNLLSPLRKLAKITAEKVTQGHRPEN